MTYDPGRGGNLPVLRSEWREPLRAQRDPVTAGSGRVRSHRERRSRVRKQSRIGKFISTFGWRAYVLPILVVLTALVLIQTLAGTRDDSAPAEGPVQGPPTMNATSTDVIGAPPKGLTEFDANLPTGILPDGGPYTQQGEGTWHIVPGTSPQVGEGTLKVFSYAVEVEDGIDTTPYGGDEGFARMVTETLANPKSWTHSTQFAFRRVDSGTPDFRVSLTSPMTTREGCGYEIQIETSCYNPAFGQPPESRVLINEARWVRGAVPFQGDIGSYRQYLINHEVGHAIGYRRHEACPEEGALAPIMMQQTFTTSNNDAAKLDPDTVKGNGLVCRFNPWPYPIAGTS